MNSINRKIIGLFFLLWIPFPCILKADTNFTPKHTREATTGLSSTSRDLKNILKSVFYMESEVTGTSGSGFVIEGNILVTNFHVLNSMIDVERNAGLDSIFIISADDPNPIFRPIKGIIGVDLSSDLVLLQLKEHLFRKKGLFRNLFRNRGLSLDDSSLKDESSLYIIGFPDRKFTITPVTDALELDHTHMFTNNYKGSWRGVSGGPVINEKGEVFSIVFRAYTIINTVNAIKGETLQKLLNEKNEQLIGNDKIFDWIEEKRDEEKKLADAGNMHLQYNRGHRLISLIFEKEKLDVQDKQIFRKAIDLLSNAAEQGNFLSRISLGLLYCGGVGELMEADIAESSRLLSFVSKDILDSVLTPENQQYCIR